MSRLSRACKVDSNQSEIVKELERIGFSVFITSNVGDGFPDLVVGIAGRTCLVEVKTPKGKLTPDQIEFFRDYKGDAIVARATEEILEWFGMVG